MKSFKQFFLLEKTSYLSRDKNKKDSETRQKLHAASFEEHSSTAKALEHSVKALHHAAKSVPDEGQMHHLLNIAKNHETKVRPLINAHKKAAIAHGLASKEHGHVVSTYNGHPGAHKDAIKLSKSAEEASKIANSSHV